MKSGYINLIALFAIACCSQLSMAMEATKAMDFLPKATIRNVYGTLSALKQGNAEQANMTYAHLAKKNPLTLINLAITTNNVDHISLGYTALPKTERFNLTQAIATADIAETTRGVLIKAAIEIKAPDHALILSGIRAKASDNLQFLVQSSTYLSELKWYSTCFTQLTTKDFQEANNAFTAIITEQDPDMVDGWFNDFADNNPAALVYLSALTSNAMYIQQGYQYAPDKIVAAAKSASIPSKVSEWLLQELEYDVVKDEDTKAKDRFALTYFAHQLNQ